MSLEEIKKLPPEEAISHLEIYIESHPDDEEGYLLRGQKYWSVNNRKQAIDDYLKALRINPSSERARLLLDYAKSILDFYSKDLLNP